LGGKKKKNKRPPMWGGQFGKLKGDVLTPWEGKIKEFSKSIEKEKSKKIRLPFEGSILQKKRTVGGGKGKGKSDREGKGGGKAGGPSPKKDKKVLFGGKDPEKGGRGGLRFVGGFRRRHEKNQKKEKERGRPLREKISAATEGEQPHKGLRRKGGGERDGEKGVRGTKGDENRSRPRKKKGNPPAQEKNSFPGGDGQ